MPARTLSVDELREEFDLPASWNLAKHLKSVRHHYTSGLRLEQLARKHERNEGRRDRRAGVEREGRRTRLQNTALRVALEEWSELYHEHMVANFPKMYPADLPANCDQNGQSKADKVQYVFQGLVESFYPSAQGRS